MPQIQVNLSADNRITHDLGEDKVTVGRLADNALQVDDGSVSSHHAEIVFEGGVHRIHDLGSTNGTFVNGEQVTDAVLRNGDEVRFGRIECVYSSEEKEAAAQSLPESSTTAAEAGTQSARPANFASTSPVPKGAKDKDPLGAALYALAALAIASLFAAAFFVLTMQATPAV